MTDQEAITELKKTAELDTEEAHMEADKILCELLKSLGHAHVVDEFKKIQKWYS